MIFVVRKSPEVSVIALQQTREARRSDPCLERTLRFEVAPSDAPPPGNASDAIINFSAVVGLILRCAKTDSPSVM